MFRNFEVAATWVESLPPPRPCQPGWRAVSQGQRRRFRSRGAVARRIALRARALLDRRCR